LILHRTSHDPSQDPKNRRNQWDPQRVSKTWKSVQQRKIPKATHAYDMGPCNRAPPRSTSHTSRPTPTSKLKRTRRDAKVCERTLKEGNDSRVV
jgi:hypothetical protein